MDKIQVAIEAAKVAGEIIINGFLADKHSTTRKKDGDETTEIDIEAARAIKKVIKRYFPDHDIITEEDELL